MGVAAEPHSGAGFQIHAPTDISGELFGRAQSSQQCGALLFFSKILKLALHLGGKKKPNNHHGCHLGLC